jgi:O-antigen/teichoic acid export membrane protein
VKYVSFLWLSPILTAIGKKIGIDTHYFAKNSSIVLVGHAIAIIRGIVTGYLVALLFPQKMYGEYQFILSITGAMAIFGVPGLASATGRATARGETFTNRGILMFLFPISSIGSLLLIATIPFLGIFDRAELWPLFLVAALFFPLSHIATVLFGGIAWGKERFDLILKTNIIWSIIMIGATILILMYWPSALLMLIASMTIPWVIQLLFLPHLSHTDANREYEGKIIKYGWQITLATLPVNMVWYLDKLLISAFFGLNQLAIFSVALLIPEQIKSLTKQFFPIAFPRQAKGSDSKERRNKLCRIVAGGTALFSCFIILYIVLSPWFMPFLFPQYTGANIILITNIAMTTLIVIPASLFPQYLEAQGMIKELQRSHWIAAILFGIFLIGLVPNYGALGAVIARGIFRVTYVGYAGWFLWKTPIRDQESKKM